MQDAEAMLPAVLAQQVIAVFGVSTTDIPPARTIGPRDIRPNEMCAYSGGHDTVCVCVCVCELE